MGQEKKQYRSDEIVSFIAQSQIGGIFHAKIEKNFPLLYANDCYYRLHGYTKEEFEEKFHGQAERVVLPEDIAVIEAELRKAIEEGKEAVALEYRVLHGSGKLAWMHANAGLTRTEEGLLMSGMLINIDERKSFEQQLLWSEKKFQIAVRQTRIHVWEYDFQSRRIIQGEQAFPFFGSGKIIKNVPEDQIARRVIHPEDAVRYAAMYTRLHQGARKAETVVRIREADGEYYWQRLHYTMLLDEQGRPGRAVAVSEDITAQKEAEQRYFQEEHLRQMLSADLLLSVKIDMSSEQILHIWSEVYNSEAIKKIESYEQLCDKIAGLMENSGDRKRYREQFAPAALEKAVESGIEILNGEFRITKADGHIVWCTVRMAMMQDPVTGQRIGFLYMRDVDERKKTELALRQRAEIDSLTGVYNRQTVESMIRQRMQWPRSEETPFALCIIDMDNFKQVNDQHGHYVGDRILQEVGRILQEDLGSHTIAGRLGGDEFLVFSAGKETATELAERLCERLHVYYAVGSKTLLTTASVGVVVAESQSDFVELFQKADAALYDAKAQGKARYVGYGENVERRHEAYILRDSCIARGHLGERCMLDQIDDSIFVIDEETHDVLFMNSIAKRVFGIEEYLGKKCYDILQGFSQPCVFCQNHLPDESGFKTWENLNARLHKRFMIRDRIVQWDGKRARLEIFTDLTEHELRLESTVNAEHVLLECAALMLAAKTLEDVMQEVLKNAGYYFQADRAYFVTTSSRDAISIAPQDWCADGIKTEPEENGRIENSELSQWLEDLRYRRVVMFASIEQLQGLFPEKYQVLKEKGVASFAAVALLDENGITGYVGIENPRENLDNTTFLLSLSYFLQNEISKRKMQQIMAYEETHDPLSGLLNWTGYTRFIGQIYQEAVSSLGVLAIDIIHLWLMNQEYGIDYSDQLIQTLAGYMQENFSLCKAFRLTGGSFLVICQDLSYEIFLQKVRRLRVQMSKEYPGMLAYGHAWADEDINLNALINQAKDQMMVGIQQNRVRLMSNDKLRAIREKRLRTAIQKKSFLVYLQPMARVDSGEICGMEALVRYYDKEHGIVAPDKFLPKLEMEDCIGYIDFFVMEEVCKTIQSWQRRGLPLLPVSINFSRMTLMQEGVVEKMNRMADRYAVKRSLLEIEITESTGDAARRALLEVSKKIRSSGYGLLLDDFGAQYSNISILASLPLSGLKFDKSLIHDLYANATTRLLVESMIQVCHQTGIESIAEGVEDPEQLAILRGLGCTYAQGYLYNKPIPIRDFEKKYLETKSRLGMLK